MTDMPLYVVLCTYGPDANSRRPAAMAEHLAYLRKNRHRLRFAGPLLTDDGQAPAGSNAIVEVGDRASAEEFIEKEAFCRAGMFEDIEITRFRSMTENRQDGVTPDPDRPMFLCRWRIADSAGLPVAGNLGLPPDDASVHLVEGGALLTDDASQIIGALLIVEAADRATAERYVDHDIQRRSVVTDDVRISRWRFGQALGGS